jgi:hypothetical protein
LTGPGLLRLYPRLRERLEDAPEAFRAEHSLKDPDCFLFQTGVSGLDANYWFHFLVNDRAEEGVLPCSPRRSRGHRCIPAPTR